MGIDLISSDLLLHPGLFSGLARNHRSLFATILSSPLSYGSVPRSILPVPLDGKKYFIMDELNGYLDLPGFLVTLIDELKPTLNFLLMIYIF
jgi:hypothetical protein